MQPDTLTLKLDPPIKLGDLSYGQLKLREPTAGELVQTDGLSDYASDIRIISVVAAMPEAAVKLIPARPFMKASRYLAGFMRPAPVTGEDA